MVIKAEILTLGREILIGKTVNTNASWIASQLTSMGFSVERIVVAPDSVAEISAALTDSLQRHADVLIVTGGLGSTYDDLTVDGLASALKVPKEINDRALGMVRNRYESLGLDMTPLRKKLAIMPEGSKPLRNESGSAPGLFIESKGSMIFCLPGVPREMIGIFQSEVHRIIEEKTALNSFMESSLTITGMPESSLAPIIEEWLPRSGGIYLKSHPMGGEGNPSILVHLSLLGKDKGRMRRALRAAEESFKSMVKHHGGKIQES